MRIKQYLSKLSKPILSLIFWVTVWTVCALTVDREILLPSPISVFRRMLELFGDKNYFISVGMSISRILIGYAAGVAMGIILAFISFFSKTIEVLITPMLTAVRATPVASFIILALVWMGRGAVPSFISVLMVVPVVYGGVRMGLASTDKKLEEVSDIYGFGFIKKLRLLYIPSAAPSMISSSKTSLGLAWKAGVAAEVLCSPKNSVGGEIYSAKLYLESVDLFVWTVTVILLSLALELLLSVSTSRVQRHINTGEKVNEKNDS